MCRPPRCGQGGPAPRPEGVTVTIAIIALVCVVLLALAFLAPRLSRGPQRGVDSTLGPSRKATNTSASLGRKGRGRIGV